jgi:hypothetical protein
MSYVLPPVKYKEKITCIFAGLTKTGHGMRGTERINSNFDCIFKYTMVDFAHPRRTTS